MGRRVIGGLGLLAGLLCFAQLIWKHLMVVRFFRRPIPNQARQPRLVSVLQPVMSGDPLLPSFLAHNLSLPTRYPLEFLYLADETDPDGQRICRELLARHPRRTARLLVLPEPGAEENPKMVKVIAGAREARGDVLVVLDDDTRLPPSGLERCLPSLDLPGVGLAFGLPYYVGFANLWSRLVSVFVNGNALLTYVPYTAISDPLTINGMFYALRREVFEAIGGFDSLVRFAADDFAVAHHLRAAGYRLAQTPLLHPISTTVRGPRHYASLMRRWFSSPRESLLRHLTPRERMLVVALAALPALVPLALLLALLARPSRGKALFAAGYFGYSFAIFAHLNAAYLRGATPWRHIWMVPLVQLLAPIHMLHALIAPNRVNWRGRIMAVERGGVFRYVGAAAERRPMS
jgi:ceramide glucosyltransferase